MTLNELQQKQSWSLEQKVAHSLDVISTFVNRKGGIDKVYASVSGGKDSDVLHPDTRQLREFKVKGQTIMAYSRKDAITRLKHKKK